MISHTCTKLTQTVESKFYSNEINFDEYKFKVCIFFQAILPKKVIIVALHGRITHITWLDRCLCVPDGDPIFYLTTMSDDVNRLELDILAMVTAHSSQFIASYYSNYIIGKLVGHHEP